MKTETRVKLDTKHVRNDTTDGTTPVYRLQSFKRAGEDFEESKLNVDSTWMKRVMGLDITVPTYLFDAFSGDSLYAKGRIAWYSEDKNSFLLSFNEMPCGLRYVVSYEDLKELMRCNYTQLGMEMHLFGSTKPPIVFAL